MAGHSHSHHRSSDEVRRRPDLRADFAPVASPEPYPRGAILFRQGEPALGLYLLVRGRVKLSLTDDSGRTATFRTVTAGYVLGLPATIGGAAHLFTAEVVEASEIAFVESGQALAFLHSHPDICFDVVQTLSHELLELPPVVHQRTTRHRHHTDS